MRRPALILVATVALIGSGLLVQGLLGGGATAGETYRVVKNLDDFFAPNVIRVEVGTQVE